MRVLFLHDAFPAQFGHLGWELTRRYGWDCHFVVEAVSTCPSPPPEMLEALDVRSYPLSDEYRRRDPTPWPQVFGRFLESAEAAYEAVRRRPELEFDLVVAHGGRGAPTPFLRDVATCPIINYCEYYFAPRHRDISYRIDLPPAEPAEHFPRVINAPVLLGLVDCDAGYSATAWQRDSFPARFRPKIEVHHDGIDVAFYRPGAAPREVDGRSIPPGTKVVTFVSRGLESIRGFDLFLKVAARVAAERPDVLFVVVGGTVTHYGWDLLHTGRTTFKEWALEQVGPVDPSRFVFVGQVEPPRLAEILRLSDLHLYPSAPFVLSWSLMDAMATGVVVLASDTGPVREVVEPGVTGLVEPLFDLDRWVATALRVLDDPAAFAPIARAARDRIVSRYSLEVAIPDLRDYFERVARAGTVGQGHSGR